MRYNHILPLIFPEEELLQLISERYRSTQLGLTDSLNADYDHPKGFQSKLFFRLDPGSKPNSAKTFTLNEHCPLQGNIPPQDRAVLAPSLALAKMKTENQRKCNQAFNRPINDKTHTCTGARDPKQPAWPYRGNSGGPLLYAEEAERRLVGPIAKHDGRKIEDEAVVIAARVNHLMQWIQCVTRSSLDQHDQLIQDDIKGPGCITLCKDFYHDDAALKDHCN